MTAFTPYPYVLTSENTYWRHCPSSFTSVSSRPSSLEESRDRFSPQPKTATTRKVHWASDVVDNDQTPRIVRISSMRNTKSTSLMPSQTTHRSPIPAMNSSVRIMRNRIPNDFGLYDTRHMVSGPMINSQKTSRGQLEAIPKRQPRTSSSTPQLHDHVTSLKIVGPSGTSRSKRRATQFDAGSLACTSSSARSYPSNKKHFHIDGSLPPVPEAPPFTWPPPTPRISRLPTPDLDDIGYQGFCSCDDSHYDGHRKLEYSRNDERSSKLNAQMQTAQLYIQSRRC
ncbi:hypothetical protein GLAREA_08284 [Glarea lozoyensis ATCC 20868]|uniref:Uncharacterized protein n=1 Tax=Glarea lozoyensis (strain ATCC 20868 / MF5171) TaxID=1116229 RepID=S3CD17_GLAL2|nr:uncharacterized protein GLAREA_08284 [Glarea lozoyensis ATCC 20868]EPE24432.1 hypothetical protein GLAREA_08284 [Glarea lozoyensis ATCC 20868]